METISAKITLKTILTHFFQAKSDNSKLEASQQENLQKEFEQFIDDEGEEKTVIEMVHLMCIESLDPETMDKWDEVLNALYRTRKDLKYTTLPYEKTIKDY